MNTCETCKHWSKGSPQAGICSKMGKMDHTSPFYNGMIPDSIVTMFIPAEYISYAFLTVGKDFGCTLHEGEKGKALDPTKPWKFYEQKE